MNGWASNRTLGLGGAMASMSVSPSQMVGQFHLAPVTRPGAFEIGGVEARLDGGVDPHLADDPPRILALQRTRRRVIGRATRIRHHDDVARGIAARRDRV